jgi:hypothetical protein
MLSATDLRDVLKWVVSLNGHVTESRGNRLEVHYLLRLDGLFDVTLRTSWQTLETLAEQVRTHTSLRGSTAPRPLAELMADVAIIVSQSTPEVVGPPEIAQRLSILAHKVRTNFAVACTVCIARSRGYDIPVSRIPWDETSSAIQGGDGNQLVRIFGESLREASFTGTAGSSAVTPALQQGAAELPQLTIRRLEIQFADAHPIPMPSPRPASQVLTAESFSNLLSVSEMENWSSTVVLRLLKEVLNPAVHPHLVHHLTTVSGADWRRLHAWIYGPDGSELWDPRKLWNLENESNQRLSLLSLAAQENLP